MSHDPTTTAAPPASETPVTPLPGTPPEVKSTKLIVTLTGFAAVAGALFMVFSGGLILGAVYMATDMVTSPVTPRGTWIFGAGVGVLVVLIRIWGGLPEGVMYAILIMNAFVPFINKWTQPRVFGTVREPRKAERKEATP